MAYDFDKIAARYDRMNRVMTLGLDRCWRKRAVRGLEGSVLDVACGTGDMAISLAERGCTVTGIDLSEEMLAIAKQKTASANSHFSILNYQFGDAETLPFAAETFDAVTCAFGVRNFVHLEKGLGEMMRVLKTGGMLVILELSTPDSSLVRPFYNLYTRKIIPWLGQRIAGSREAYTYLPESIEHFPKGVEFLRVLSKMGYGFFPDWQKRTFGVCRLYRIQKLNNVKTDPLM